MGSLCILLSSCSAYTKAALAFCINTKCSFSFACCKNFQEFWPRLKFHKQFQRRILCAESTKDEPVSYAMIWIENITFTVCIARCTVLMWKNRQLYVFATYYNSGKFCNILLLHFKCRPWVPCTSPRCQRVICMCGWKHLRAVALHMVILKFQEKISWIFIC